MCLRQSTSKASNSDHIPACSFCIRRGGGREERGRREGGEKREEGARIPLTDNGSEEGGWTLIFDPQGDQEVTGEVWYIGEGHSGGGSCLHILYNQNKCYDRESSLILLSLLAPPLEW